MIDRGHRFQGQAGLRFVQRNAAVARGPMMSLKYVGNARRSSGRVAVVVSKKVHKSAVVRNRIRRRIYEICRLNHGADDPVDMVFVIYDARVALLPFAELTATLNRLIRQTATRPHAIVNTKKRDA